MSALYYLSRGGAPEGPFDEARLVYMIQSGELTTGGACLVGQTQWLALTAFPVFAQAFAARAASVASYAQAAPANFVPPTPTISDEAPQPAAGAAHAPPAPTISDAGSPPTAGAAYGASPATAGYGAPQPPFAAVVPAVKKSPRGLLIAVIAGILLLFVAGAAVAAYLLFFSSGGARSTAQIVPQDCELLVEVPSVRKLALDLHGVQFLDSSLRDDKKFLDDAADSVSKAFDISPSDATLLLAAAETVGFSARRLESTPEAVLALGMRDAAAVNTLFKSSRFVAAGAVGQGGQRYVLTPKPLPAAASQDLALKTLSQAQLSASDHAALVWFPAQKVLALGSAALLADLAQVIEAHAASIEQNPAYQAAKKDFESGARLTAFVDPGALANIREPKVKQLVDGYFTAAGPFTSSLHVEAAGLVSSFVVHVTGSKLPRESGYEAPLALDLADRLPAETFAYLAVSTRSKLSGTEAETLLLDQVGSLDSHTRARAEQGLRETEQLLGVSASKLIDDAGAQAVLGIAANADTALDQLGKGPAAAAQLGLIWVQELKDASEYKKLAAQLKQKLLPSAHEVAFTDDGAGFSLTPRGSTLPIRLRLQFLDKYLVLTAGGSALCDRAEAAFTKGERTLKEDAAHKAALSALPATQHFRVWIDTGRLLDTLLKNQLIKARLAEQGLSLDKITLSGPNRVVSAFAMRAEVQNEIWTCRVDALNFQAFAPLALGAAELGGSLVGLPGL